MLDGIDFCHGFGVCGITTQAPNGVGGIKNDATLVHHVDGLLDILSLFVSEHNAEFENVGDCIEILIRIAFDSFLGRSMRGGESRLLPQFPPTANISIGTR